MNRKLDIKTRRFVGEVIENNLDYLVRFAVFRVGNKADAEDIVHDAVVRLLDRDFSRINAESIRLYLFRIVYNLCQDYHTGSSLILPSSEFGDISNENDTEYGEDDDMERLRGLLDGLPPKEVEVIRMNVMDELSFAEISRILSVPASTIKSRFKSGMDKLKNLFFNKN